MYFCVCFDRPLEETASGVCLPELVVCFLIRGSNLGGALVFDLIALICNSHGSRNHELFFIS